MVESFLRWRVETSILGDNQHTACNLLDNIVQDGLKFERRMTAQSIMNGHSASNYPSRSDFDLPAPINNIDASTPTPRM